MRSDKKLTAKIREVFDNYEDPNADFGWQKLRKKYPATPLTAKIREVFDHYEDPNADFGWQELRKNYPAMPLTAKIREVFDHYEDPNADFGWQELRKNYPVKRHRKPLVLWFSAAAAMLILALGVWIVIPESRQQNSTAKTDGSIPTIKNQTENSSKQSIAGNAAETGIKNTNGATSGEELAHVKGSGQQTTNNSISDSENKRQKNFGKEIALVSSKKSVTIISSRSGKKNQIKEIDNPSPSENSISLVQNNLVQNENPSPKGNAFNTTDLTENSQFPDSVSLNSTNENSQPETALVQNSSEKEKKRTLLDLALEEDAKKKKKEEKKSDKKVIFGLYAGSFISYAAGSENKLNVGAGFSSDISLTKNLKLSTGIALSQNQLTYNNNKQIPTSAHASFQNSIQKSPSASGADGVQGMASALKVISYNLNQYEARLLALDIPVNLKYSFSTDKNEYFLSAGVSSGTFLNESYTYKYSSSGPSYEKLPDSKPVINEGKTEKTFSNFDFARMFNFSFGVGYPLGKQNRLIIEPFLKYPLKDVGAEHLRFGSGGVNLKLNFQSLKGKKR